MIYDHRGEPIEARDVLDNGELAEYDRSRRDRGGSFKPPHRARRRVNEDGYDQYGDYHPDAERQRAR